MTRRLWELLILLVMIGVVTKILVDAFVPLAPYVVIGVIVIVLVAGLVTVGRFLFNRYRSW